MSQNTTFRSTTGVPISVALTSGHTVVVPPEGKPIHPRFHREAVRRGCLPKNAESFVDPSVTDQREKREAAIEKGLRSMLESTDAKAFTQDNQPNLNKLRKELGWQPDREEVEAVWSRVLAEIGPGKEAPGHDGPPASNEGGQDGSQASNEAGHDGQDGSQASGSEKK